MIFTAPEVVTLLAGSRVDCATWNSWIDSSERFVVVVPTVSSVTSTPSTSMREERPERPCMEQQQNPALSDPGFRHLAIARPHSTGLGPENSSRLVESPEFVSRTSGLRQPPAWCSQKPRNQFALQSSSPGKPKAL